MKPICPTGRRLGAKSGIALNIRREKVIEALPPSRDGGALSPSLQAQPG
jgi:hypothetical protein